MSGWIDIRIGPKRGEIEHNPELYYDLVMIGDSITHMWEEDAGEVVRKAMLKDYSILNLGFCGDRTQEILWDVGDGGLLEGYLTRAIQIMIGTNNLPADEPEKVADGIAAIVRTAATKHPEARILLLPVFPRGMRPDDPIRAKIARVNDLIRKLADGSRIVWCDFSDRLTHPDGTLRAELFRPDALHLTAAGYGVWARAMKPHYDAALGR